MAGKGFHEVYNLKGGINAWHGLTAAGPVDMGMLAFRGNETPKEIIGLAYGMEDCLRGFYSTMAERLDDSDVVGTLNKLAGIEENHKQRLFDLYVTLDSTVIDKETFEAENASELMEGGFSVDDFVKKQVALMKTVSDVLSIAMMLETQAMDLYMRYSQSLTDERSRGILHDMADEEKAHLAMLGRLMQEKV